MNNKMDNRPDWRRAALPRRILLATLIVGPALVASRYMAAVLPHHGATIIEVGIVVLFGILFAWVALGFWTALLGFITLLLGRDRFAISRTAAATDTSVRPGVRTAVVMPICNEDADRVFAGVRATYLSLARSGGTDGFDFYVLSDSSQPDRWVEEEVAWSELCRAVEGFGRIHYRRRRSNIKRKSGNIADFCRRWGAGYDYMVVLDADSVMAGDTLRRMVLTMEQHPRIGILQTVPVTVNRTSLLARIQQFANHVYGPIFSAGLNFWQLGDGHYWGHNVAIRVMPFIRHCALPRLPGRAPLGGEILSHDFVEASLMRRAGWEVWLAYDLGGSWEETPPTLLDELKRDRRWCQGNLQHARLLFAEGLHPLQRLLFVRGILSYASALLWAGLLALGSTEVLLEAFHAPVYFTAPHSLFPSWPVSHPMWALALLLSTSLMLLVPKFLAVVLLLARGRAGRFGGAPRLLTSVLAEILVSTLLAPVRMWFHSKFVLITLLGRPIGWGTQRRDDGQTGWSEAIAHHGVATLIAAAWGVAAYRINVYYFWWLLPVLAGLVLGVPMSVLSSRASLGRLARRWGLFLIPEELDPPRELAWLDQEMARRARTRRHLPDWAADGFVRAVVDPQVNALHLALLRRRHGDRRTADRWRELRDRALAAGPQALSERQKVALLADPFSMADLHLAVWGLPEGSRAAQWGIGGSGAPHAA